MKHYSSGYSHSSESCSFRNFFNHTTNNNKTESNRDANSNFPLILLFRTLLTIQRLKRLFLSLAFRYFGSSGDVLTATPLTRSVKKYDTYLLVCQIVPNGTTATYFSFATSSSVSRSRHRHNACDNQQCNNNSLHNRAFHSVCSISL